MNKKQNHGSLWLKVLRQLNLWNERKLLRQEETRFCPYPPVSIPLRETHTWVSLILLELLVQTLMLGPSQPLIHSGPRERRTFLCTYSLPFCPSRADGGRKSDNLADRLQTEHTLFAAPEQTQGAAAAGVFPLRLQSIGDFSRDKLYNWRDKNSRSLKKYYQRTLRRQFSLIFMHFRTRFWEERPRWRAGVWRTCYSSNSQRNKYKFFQRKQVVQCKTIRLYPQKHPIKCQDIY